MTQWNVSQSYAVFCPDSFVADVGGTPSFSLFQFSSPFGRAVSSSNEPITKITKYKHMTPMKVDATNNMINIILLITWLKGVNFL